MSYVCRLLSSSLDDGFFSFHVGQKASLRFEAVSTATKLRLLSRSARCKRMINQPWLSLLAIKWLVFSSFYIEKNSNVAGGLCTTLHTFYTVSLLASVFVNNVNELRVQRTMRS